MELTTFFYIKWIVLAVILNIASFYFSKNTKKHQKMSIRVLIFTVTTAPFLLWSKEIGGGIVPAVFCFHPDFQINGKRIALAGFLFILFYFIFLYAFVGHIQRIIVDKENNHEN